MSRAHHILPVDIVFHPSWWNAHAGITFDKDFFNLDATVRNEQIDAIFETVGELRRAS